MTKTEATLNLISLATEKISYSLEDVSYIEDFYNDEIESVIELLFVGKSCYIGQLEYFINSTVLDAELNNDLKMIMAKTANRLSKYSQDHAVKLRNKLEELSE